MDPIVYLDHAATSWPKPPEVFEAMRKAMEEAAANPGRGSHRMAVKASRVLYGTRRALADLFGVKNPNDIALTSNTTEALNLAIKGYLREGDHVIATMIEHNSVRRPLEYLKRTRGVQVDYIPVDEEGQLDVQLIEGAFRSNTRLVVCSHSSNLLGSIIPLVEIGELVKRKGAVLLVDAAQSAGMLDLHVEEMHVDMLAFPGHKGLLGPQGTGGLYISPDIDLEPLLHGGTGSQSEAVEQPTVRPDRYEAGTPNTIGYAGLQAGVKKVLEWTPQHIYQHEWELTQYMIEGLQEVGGLRILGPALGQARTGIVAFVSERYSASELAFRLDREYGIAVRAGYHCTPLAHMASGTEQTGAVRASVGISTSRDEVELIRKAIAEIHR
ncbi:aminotransferase class V-fold PLP-dependent enzyme [Paenibacillus sp. p3-SID867]|uniref:aminotransferase class V-fold PLP-dependent enzyme n=1 Tax=Paenibacillus sp. p3-SID867 TaxID=2916363 RepID=UPI0021A63830|nr:aminotransferase class V-fold PLP-dependent enzyme [Paenibacillus sp. p3-SID867]MCT1398048.1 aminotransferase class V-fold PLP-dependent enzyme [Paenibacillus sp. p3-SID867]